MPFRHRVTPLLALAVLTAAAFSQERQTPRRIRVSRDVAQSRLTEHIPPEYPPLARRARIRGTVRLQAWISKEGKVDRLEVISGHPLLVQSAMDAARQWEYDPILLNGEPIGMETTIDVIFSLPEPPPKEAPPAEARTPPEPAPPEVRQAQALLQQKEVDAALNLLRVAVSQKPENVQLRMALAGALLRNKYDVAAAIAEFQNALHLSGSLSTCMSLADAQEDIYDLPAAIVTYKHCIALSREDHYGYSKLADALYWKHDLEPATQMLSQAVAGHPNPPHTLNRIAHGMGEGFHEAIALTLAREVLRLQPENQEARERVASLERGREKSQAVLEKLHDYLARNPDSAHAWGRLAFFLHFSNHDVEGALEALRRAIDATPRDPQGYRLLSRMSGRRHGMAATIRELSQYASKYPDSPAARFALAELLLNSGQLERATAEAQAAIALDPGDPSPHGLLSAIFAARGQPQAAREEQALLQQLARDWRPRALPADPELDALLRPEQADETGRAAQEAAAVGALRMLNTACVSYESTYRAGFPMSLASLGPPPDASAAPSARQAGLIDSALASGTKNGYAFIYVVGQTNPQGHVTAYEIYADPIQPGTTGNRWFYTDQSGVIRVSTSGRAGPASPVLP